MRDKKLAVYRIQNWEKYKKLALEFKPSIIYYARDPHPLRKPPWGLKLIFYNGFDGYVFTEYLRIDEVEYLRDFYILVGPVRLKNRS